MKMPTRTAHEDTDEGTNDRTPDAVGAGTGLLCPGGLRHSVDDDADDGKNGERRDRAPADQFETACPSDQGASCGDQRKSGNAGDDGAGEAGDDHETALSQQMTANQSICANQSSIRNSSLGYCAPSQ